LLGTVLAVFLISSAVRYDNFLTAFRAAIKVSAILVAFAVTAAVAHRGWAVFHNFTPGRYLLGIVGYFFWGYLQQLLFCAWFGTRLRKAFGPSRVPGNVSSARMRLRSALICGTLASGLFAPVAWWGLRAIRGAAAVPFPILLLFVLLALPIGAVWGWFYALDRKRLLVATLSGSFFGLIHMDSYGLVVATWIVGIFLAWMFMQDRTRNIAALGFIHGFLGTTFNLFFAKSDAGALRISYRVGPWNIKEPAMGDLVIPLLCLALYVAITVWSLRHLSRTNDHPTNCIG
jgi:hypothetical protein